MYVLVMDHDFGLKEPMERKSLLTIVRWLLNKRKMAPPRKQTRFTEGSFDWLLHQYLQSMQWHNQSESTKKVKYRILNNVSKYIGDRSYKNIEKHHIIDAVDRRRDTPAAAKHFLTSLNGLFNWAVDNALLHRNPAFNIKAPRSLNTKGLLPWLEEDIYKYYHR